MTVNIVLEKLIEIERSIGVETDTNLRKQVLDAQDYILEIQKEIVEKLRREPRIFMEPFPSSRFSA
ncbi:MAG TPA: hypothetical protein VGG26_09470 [Terracidiphilus sp.]|jgi:hypothetical protein